MESLVIGGTGLVGANIVGNLLNQKHKVTIATRGLAKDDFGKNVDRYIMISTGSVYENLKIDTSEEDFEPLSHQLKWCSPTDYDYGEIKRQAEAALFQTYPHVNAVAVRFPVILGADDSTKRLYFYIEHIVKQIPINLDGLDDVQPFHKESLRMGI